ncbi:hypothetical protein HAX54_051020 [Datura stramonium]|uniref:Pentatricopeptide repeat-containing protein n=1 Tax=Datura stramonium TaxID=4076 RepID=A0ABS8RRB4_DATST|nr:hypothetical protein [Datura stramonium]
MKEVKCLDDAVTLFHQMVRMQPSPSVIVFSKLFKTMINMKHYSAVVSLFGEMQKLGIPTSVFILNIVITGKGCLMHRADCGIVTDYLVIDALCKDGNLDAAINLLNEMKRKGIPPDIITYNSLIDGLCKLGQWGKVMTLFSEMVNLNIYPNVPTFNIVIDGLCKEGKVEDAEEVMKHMVGKGVEPNIITYNAIMDGYCLRGQLGGARRKNYIIRLLGGLTYISNWNITGTQSECHDSLSSSTVSGKGIHRQLPGWKGKSQYRVDHPKQALKVMQLVPGALFLKPLGLTAAVVSEFLTCSILVQIGKLPIFEYKYDMHHFSAGPSSQRLFCKLCLVKQLLLPSLAMCSIQPCNGLCLSISISYIYGVAYYF